MERLVRDALNVPVEPGNDLPPPSVVCVRGFARQPPDPRQGTLVTSRMEVRSALGPAITRAGGIKRMATFANGLAG